jgi:hypothetical protein
MRTEEKSWLGLEGGGGVTWGRRNRAGMLADAKESGEQFLPPGSVSGEREKGKRRGERELFIGVGYCQNGRGSWGKRARNQRRRFQWRSKAGG